MKISHASRWLLVFLIPAGLGGWFITGNPVYARMAYTGITLLAVAGIWTLLSMKGIHLHRTTRTLRASMGDLLDENFEIKKEGWPGCAWLEVVNRSSLPKVGGSRLLTRIGAHQLRYYSARTLLTRRGAYLLGPTVVTTGDPFGVFSIHKTIHARNTLVVLPMTFSIPAFALPQGILPGGKAIRQRTMDVTPHATEVREYVPGDPMKRIHWPSTAHRQQFMVKQFEQDPQADIWLFLDAFGPVHCSLPQQVISEKDENIWLRRPKVFLPMDTFEYAVSIAASLANFLLMQRRVVGLACAAGKNIVLSADRGVRQLSKILETLAFLQPEGMTPLSGLVNMQANLLSPGSSVILITPSVHSDLTLAVEYLQRHNLRPGVVLIKADTFGGQGGSQEMASNLLARKVNVSQIGLGDDLGFGLASSVLYFQQPGSLNSSLTIRPDWIDT